MELSDLRPDSPMLEADQDALNAILMSEVPEADVPELATKGALPGDLPETLIVNERALECSFRGRPVSLLHYTGSPKPWERGGWTRVRADPFVRLLRRVLVEEDVAVRLGPEQMPTWLHPTRRGRIVLAVLNTINRAIRRVAMTLPEAAQDRLRHWRSAVHRQASLPHQAP
jgi:hypothetical protein